MTASRACVRVVCVCHTHCVCLLVYVCITGVSLYHWCCYFSVDFTSNRFDHIPQEICDFRQLVKLSFYRNLLRVVPEDLKLLINLKDLNLRCVCVCVCVCVCTCRRA